MLLFSSPPLRNRIGSEHTHIRIKPCVCLPLSRGVLSRVGVPVTPYQYGCRQKSGGHCRVSCKHILSRTVRDCDHTLLCCLSAIAATRLPVARCVHAPSPFPPGPSPRSRIRRHGSSRPYVAVSSNFPFPRTGPAASPFSLSCPAGRTAGPSHSRPQEYLCAGTVVHASGSQDTEYVMYHTSRGGGLRRSSPYRGTYACSQPGMPSGGGGGLLGEETLSQGDGMLCHIFLGHRQVRTYISDVFIQLMTIMSVRSTCSRPSSFVPTGSLLPGPAAAEQCLAAERLGHLISHELP